MPKNLSYEEKVKRSILKDVKLLRIPARNNIPIPVIPICQMCRRNKVTDHHYFCNKCWKIQNSNGKYNHKG